MGIWDKIGGVFESFGKGVGDAAKGIGGLYTTDDERQKNANRASEIQMEGLKNLLDHAIAESKDEIEIEKIKARVQEKQIDLMIAESKSDSKMTKAIRPTLVLTPLLLLALDIAASVILGAVGVPYVGIPPATQEGLISLLTVFGGVYGLGRSGEKVMKSWKIKKEAEK